MKLLIDIGNTRIKWAVLDEHGVGTMRAASYADWDRDRVRTELSASLDRPDAVMVGSVAGAAMDRLVTDAVDDAWGLEPKFLLATAEAAGVRNGYAVPAQLGIDRWLSVIAAFHLYKGSVCIVNVGTAMTLDGVNSEGLHLGGIIVPGPDLAITSLLQKTSEIAVRSHTGEVGPTLFAGNTLGAVRQGVTHMLAALVERALVDMRLRLGESPALVVTGGASERVIASLRVPCHVVPDLVLQGLAVLSRDR